MPEIPQPPHPVVALRAAVLAHGLQPIAVYTRGKRPFGAAWEQTRGVPPLVPAALSTGILCDRIRAVDIDIDEPEAAQRAAAVVAATLGPSSFIRTRPDSPRLTVLYRGQGKKRIIKLDAGKVEVLGVGNQFVAFGTHPNGADFDWPEDDPAAKAINGRVVGEDDLDRLEAALHAALGGAEPEPAPSAPTYSAPRPSAPGDAWARTALEAEVDRVAGAGPGGRNDALNAAAFNLGQIVAGGGLARSEVETRLTQAAIGVGLTASETRATLRSGLAAGARDPRTAPERAIEVPPTVVEAAALMAAPKPRAKAVDPLAAMHPGVDWRTPRGLIGQVSDWVMETSRRPNRPLAVAAGTAVMSALCGRWLYAPTGTALNVYLVMIAKTGAGKDRPLSAVSEVLTAAGAPQLAQTAKAFSVSGFEGLVRDNPCCVATADEIGSNLLARIANKRASHEGGEGIKAALLELWSRVYGKAPFHTTRRAQSASEAIASPSLTLFGASTPEAFYDCFKAGDALSGFLNRFLIAEGAARAPTANEFDYVAPPSVLIETIRAMIPEQAGNLGDAMGVYRSPSVTERKMRWADDATKREALALENEIGRIAEDHPRGELMARTFEYGVRLASLHAMSHTRWTVGRDDLAWGASWALDSTRAMVAAAGDLMAETEYESHVNRVKAIVRKEGTIGRRDLMRRAQFLKGRDIDAIIEHLAGAEIIEKMDVKTGERGPATRTYRWIG